MKNVKTILGVKIQSDAAERRLLSLIESKYNNDEDYSLFAEEFESADDLLNLVH